MVLWRCRDGRQDRLKMKFPMLAIGGVDAFEAQPAGNARWHEVPGLGLLERDDVLGEPRSGERQQPVAGDLDDALVQE